MKKILLGWLILGGLLGARPIFGVKAAAGLDSLTNHRTELVWQLPSEIQAEVAFFTLLVDEQEVLVSIPNQILGEPTYSLEIEADGHYVLRFEQSYSEGEHVWQLKGYDIERQLILQTERETFLVESQIQWQEWLKIAGGVLKESGEMLLTIALSVGTVVFLIIFGLFFILDFVLSKGMRALFDYLQLGGNKYRVARMGYIYDTKTDMGVPFALVTMVGQDEEGHNITITSVSDVNGIYNSITAPLGNYSLNVKKAGYFFPTRKMRPSILTQDDFYKGERVTVTATKKLVNPTIPLDPILAKDGKQTGQFQDRLWKSWQNLGKKQSVFELILFALALIGVWQSQHVFYLGMVIVYGGLVLRRFLGWFQPPNLVGRVLNEKGRGLSHTMVLVYLDTEGFSSQAMVITDKNGRFSFKLAPGEYLIKAKKNGYLGESEGRTVNADEQITIGKKKIDKTLKLVPIPVLTEEFFFGAPGAGVARMTEAGSLVRAGAVGAQEAKATTEAVGATTEAIPAVEATATVEVVPTVGVGAEPIATDEAVTTIGTTESEEARVTEETATTLTQTTVPSART